MNNHSLLIIDPAITNPSIESFNRISKIAPISVTYHYLLFLALTAY